MNAHEDRVYLRHILDAIDRIERYVEGVEQKEFKVRELLQDGVIRQLEIIGEASRRLSANMKGLYLEIPWRDIVDMRNKLIHDYFGVDVELVGVTVKRDIPELKRAVCEILKDIKKNSTSNSQCQN